MFHMRLKELREARSMSQYALAKELGISQSTVGNWESGIRQPKTEVLERIAEYFRVSVDYLLGRETGDCPADPTWINVLGRVAAGIPMEAIEEITDKEQISEAMARGGSYVGLTIHGASMEPRMREGDVVIVRLQSDAESGDTVIAMVGGGEAACKILQKTKDGIFLLSTNPAFAPLFYSNRDIEEMPVRILGRVVELRAKF